MVSVHHICGTSVIRIVHIAEVCRRGHGGTGLQLQRPDHEMQTTLKLVGAWRKNEIERDRETEREKVGKENERDKCDIQEWANQLMHEALKTRSGDIRCCESTVSPP